MRRQTLLLVSAVAALALFAGSAAAVADADAQSLSTQCHDPSGEEHPCPQGLSANFLDGKDTIQKEDSLSAGPFFGVGTTCNEADGACLEDPIEDT